MASNRAQSNPTKFRIRFTEVKAHANRAVYTGIVISARITWLGVGSLLGLLSRFSGCSPYDYACACVDNTSVSNGPYAHAMLKRRT